MVISSSTCSFRGIEPVSLAGEKEEIKKDEDEKGRMWTAFLRVTFNQYLSLLSSFLTFSEWDALKFPETGKILFSEKKFSEAIFVLVLTAAIQKSRDFFSYFNDHVSKLCISPTAIAIATKSISKTSTTNSLVEIKESAVAAGLIIVCYDKRSRFQTRSFRASGFGTPGQKSTRQAQSVLERREKSVDRERLEIPIICILSVTTVARLFLSQQLWSRLLFSLLFAWSSESGTLAPARWPARDSLHILKGRPTYPRHPCRLTASVSSDKHVLESRARTHSPEQSQHACTYYVCTHVRPRTYRRPVTSERARFTCKQ